MKFNKIFALLLAVCLLCTAMVACNSTGKTEETTEAATTVSIAVTLIVKDGNTEAARETITYSGSTPTLGALLDIYNAMAGVEAEPFDENGLLTTVGELTKADGKSFIAFYESEGKNEAFDSIKDQPVADGQVIVIVLE